MHQGCFLILAGDKEGVCVLLLAIEGVCCKIGGLCVQLLAIGVCGGLCSTAGNRGV